MRGLRIGFPPPGLFPLSISANNRYLKSPNGSPFLIIADTCWSGEIALSTAQIGTYLDYLLSQGFTAVVVGMEETAFSGNTPKDANYLGDRPFSTPNNFGTASGAYWNLVDAWFAAAKARGMLILGVLAFYGTDSSQGWIDVVHANSNGNCSSLGSFLGARYGAGSQYGNVVWVAGGDYGFGDSADIDKYGQIAAGILSQDAGALFAFEGLRTFLGSNYADGKSWFKINTIYTDGTDEYLDAASARAYSPTKPFFLVEGWYEGEVGSAADYRRQMYVPIIAGGMGSAFGNKPRWGMGEPVANGGGGAADVLANHLATTGTIQAGYAAALFKAYQWWRQTRDDSVVSSGLGTGTSRVVPGLADDGSFSHIWVPSSQTVTVVMSKLAPSSVRARLYNTTTGAYTTVGGSPFANSGTQGIATGGERVIVLDGG